MKKAIFVLSFVSLFSLNLGNVIPTNTYENNYGNNVGTNSYGNDNNGNNNYRNSFINRFANRFTNRFSNNNNGNPYYKDYRNNGYQNNRNTQYNQNVDIPQNTNNQNVNVPQNTNIQNDNYQNVNNVNVYSNSTETIYDGTVYEDIYGDDYMENTISYYDGVPEFNEKTQESGSRKPGNSNIQFNPDDFEVTKDVDDDYEITNNLVGMTDGKTIQGTDCTQQNFCSYWMKKDVTFKYNGVNCYVQSAFAGPNDYLYISSDQKDREYKIDINGILQCKVAGTTINNIQYFHVQGNIKNNIDVINKANNQLVEKRNKTNFSKTRDSTKKFTLSDNELKFSITLSNCNSVWSSRNGNECVRGDIVIGEKSGRCGNINGVQYFCKNNYCCSKYGYCGRNDNYCKAGCQSAFSVCSN